MASQMNDDDLEVFVLTLMAMKRSLIPLLIFGDDLLWKEKILHGGWLL